MKFVDEKSIPGNIPTIYFLENVSYLALKKYIYM